MGTRKGLGALCVRYERQSNWPFSHQEFRALRVHGETRVAENIATVQLTSETLCSPPIGINYMQHESHFSKTRNQTLTILMLNEAAIMHRSNSWAPPMP